MLAASGKGTSRRREDGVATPEGGAQQRQSGSGYKRGTTTASWQAWTRRSRCVSPSLAIKPRPTTPWLTRLFCSAAARYPRFLGRHFGTHGFYLKGISEHYNAHTAFWRTEEFFGGLQLEKVNKGQ